MLPDNQPVFIDSGDQVVPARSVRIEFEVGAALVITDAYTVVGVPYDEEMEE